MLDDSCAETFRALNELVELRKSETRPILFWIGAGASRWAGIPGWADLADKMRREFHKREGEFDNSLALQLIENGKFPEFFGHCKRVNKTRFNKMLVGELNSNRLRCPIYERFLSALRRSTPCQILTTNADELLELGLGIQPIQTSNVERVPGLIKEGKDFVCKLHGSISDIESLVFSDEDYKALLLRPEYLNSLSQAFQSSHVVFFGYGLADEYVLNALRTIQDLTTLFGSGPHFACLTEKQTILPDSVRLIRYRAECYRDHRSAIQVLEEVTASGPVLKLNETGRDENQPSDKLISGHLLCDLYPPGKWASSERFEISPIRDGTGKGIVYSGHGITDAELPSTVATGMHDLIVGLLCFERVFISSLAIGRIVQLIGDAMTIRLASVGAIRFLHQSDADVILYGADTTELEGTLTQMYIGDYAGGKQPDIEKVLRRQIKPAPGHEGAGSKVIDALCKPVSDSTIILPSTGVSRIDQDVHSLLVRPSVRKMLGMSEGAPSRKIPTWLKFPILRLAHVVRLGKVCRELNLASVKLDFGHEHLANLAFRYGQDRESANSMASYVVSGDLGGDLGYYLNTDPAILETVLKFRESSEGLEFQREILSCLASSEGSELGPAINAALRRVIPTPVLARARKKFATLTVSPRAASTPAVWHDPVLADAVLGLWRKHSGNGFRAICEKLKLTKQDQCPCGSGERIKWCCAEALSVNL